MIDKQAGLWVNNAVYDLKQNGLLQPFGLHLLPGVETIKRGKEPYANYSPEKEAMVKGLTQVFPGVDPSSDSTRMMQTMCLVAMLVQYRDDKDKLLATPPGEPHV